MLALTFIKYPLLLHSSCQLQRLSLLFSNLLLRNFQQQPTFRLKIISLLLNYNQIVVSSIIPHKNLYCKLWYQSSQVFEPIIFLSLLISDLHWYCNDMYWRKNREYMKMILYCEWMVYKGHWMPSLEPLQTYSTAITPTHYILLNRRIFFLVKINSISSENKWSLLISSVQVDFTANFLAKECLRRLIWNELKDSNLLWEIRILSFLYFSFFQTPK